MPGSIFKTRPESSFPLMAWNFTVWNPDLDLAAYFRSMRDCGLTIGGFVRPGELDVCHAAGLQAMVYDERLSSYDWRKLDRKAMQDRVTATMQEVGRHPAVIGYYLKDEPNAEEFEGLAAASDVVKELHPGTWPYINLFPHSDVTEAQRGTVTYDEYVERFMSICKPPIISYDRYCLQEDGGNNLAYFTNLELIRALSVRHHVPFVNIVQSLALWTLREPSAADYRFQAYTTLAYGAAGITYFTFVAPGVGNFRGSPIDHFGYQTPAYGSMRNINFQVARLSSTLKQLRHDKAYHIGNVPEGCRGQDKSSLVESIEGDFVAGEFTHQDASRYVMLVNPSTDRSTKCRPKLRGVNGAIKMVSPYTGELIPYEGEQCLLAPGQGVLLRPG